jgi:hypothetical protein
VTTLYSFDTSAFINGRRDLLPPETFPSLWSRVEEMIGHGAIRSTDEVERELSKRADEVHTWAKTQTDLFVSLDERLQRETSAILKAHPRLLGKGGGRNAADPFVIALASLNGGVVVTEERPRNLTSPRIPDVCHALGVRCLGLVDFIREQGWTF